MVCWSGIEWSGVGWWRLWWVELCGVGKGWGGPRVSQVWKSRVAHTATKTYPEQHDIVRLIKSLCTNLYKYPKTNRDERTKEWRKKKEWKEEWNKYEKYGRVWCRSAEQSRPRTIWYSSVNEDIVIESLCTNIYKYPKPTEMKEGRNEEKRKNGRKKEIRMKSMIGFDVVVQSRVFQSRRKVFCFFFVLFCLFFPTF